MTYCVATANNCVHSLAISNLLTRPTSNLIIIYEHDERSRLYYTVIYYRLYRYSKK